MSVVDKKTFNLLRWFSILSLVSIAVIGVTLAILLSRFLSDHMLNRDAVVTMEFVQSIAQARNTSRYFESQDRGGSQEAFEDFLKRIVVMPEVERVNVYGSDGTVLWSDQPGFIGQNFSVNLDLEIALSGKLALNTGSSGKPEKAEHVFDREVAFFAEMYIPIWNASGDKVVGAVEVYKVPLALFESIRQGQRLVWMSAAIGGLFLYASLFWIVSRADIVIKGQHQELIHSETMAAIGEITSAVAHGVRNPLASIRSSAEVAIEEKNLDFFHRASEDIIKEADRLDALIRELFSYSRPVGDAFVSIPFNELVRETVQGFASEMDQKGIKWVINLIEPSPVVNGDRMLLCQALHNLIANAVEAMPDGGNLTVSGQRIDRGKRFRVTIFDTGQGIPKSQLKKVFEPLFTSKPKGLGMGLILARRIIERHRGTIDLSSREGHGTEINIKIPISS